MDAVPVSFGELHDIGAARHAGVVDEDVDAPKLGDRASDHAFDAGDVAHIGGNRQRAVLVGCERCRDALGELCVDVNHRHAGAGLGESRGSGPTDALAGTGHQGYLIFEEHGGSPPGSSLLRNCRACSKSTAEAPSIPWTLGAALTLG